MKTLILLLLTAGLVYTILAIREQHTEIVMLQTQVSNLESRVRVDESAEKAQTQKIKKLYRNEGTLGRLIVEIIDVLSGEQPNGNGTPNEHIPAT